MALLHEFEGQQHLLSVTLLWRTEGRIQTGGIQNLQCHCVAVHQTDFNFGTQAPGVHVFEYAVAWDSWQEQHGSCSMQFTPMALAASHMKVPLVYLHEFEQFCAACLFSTTLFLHIDSPAGR